MKVEATALPGVLLIAPDVHADDRGLLYEGYHAERYRAAGIAAPFVQDNVSVSHRGVLRGLHLQHPCAQAKLVSVLAGAVFDVAVDVRLGSPTFAHWTGAVLSAANNHQMFIPTGFAHGFCVLGARAVVVYKCSAPFAPEAALAIAWDDPTIGIAWPVASPVLSAADAAAPRLEQLPAGRLPAYARAD
jgi:dTDP-4-dehydrorhamnose 3,5-epimerase